LAITVSGRIRSSDVIEQLARLISLHGAPRHLCSDNGAEFFSHAVLKWLREHRIDTAFSDPGKPWQNGLDESFNGKFRDECLKMEWFRTRAEARVVIETWKKVYNQSRPHCRCEWSEESRLVTGGLKFLLIASAINGGITRRDAERTPDIINLCSGLMLFDGVDNLFFGVTLLHCEISIVLG
jgi:putative transposase